jgi:hypothetical protein
MTAPATNLHHWMIIVNEKRGSAMDRMEERLLLPEGELEKQEVGPGKAPRIKRELEILERELNRLIEMQRTYSKRMLKFGFSSWIFGLSVFFLAITVLNAPLLGRIPLISTFLLAFAATVPILITVVQILRFDTIIKSQENIRRGLLVGYQGAILKRVVGLRNTTRHGDEE